VPFTFNVTKGEAPDAGHGAGGHDHDKKKSSHNHKQVMFATRAATTVAERDGAVVHAL